MTEGSQIGAYRLVRRIGEGGMGSVWLAEHTMLGRRAAIKVLHPEYSSRPEFITRFFNEARAATAIEDPGIVQVFDFGHADGRAYIVMELLDGEPLDHRLARVGALDVRDTLRIMRQVASSVGAAHARGIVHRDLKPENIFIVRDPEVPGGERAKVLDFGIAKVTGDRSMKTQTSAVMGTPTYMSPEQCRGAGHVDQRSDVYALGCVLFRVLCGRPPFDAEGAGDILAMHLREPPPAPSMLRAGIPADVDRLVLCCLAKDPGQRFASGADLAVALGALLGSSPQLAPPPMYATGPTPTTLSAAAGTKSATVGGSSRVIVAGVIGVVVAGGAIAVIATRHSDNATQPAPQPVALPAPPPTKPAPPPKPDPQTDVTARMTTVLTAFDAWSKDHAGAACPDVATLGAPADDPWHHAFQLTCTDQPGDQIIGLVSAGPDGAAGTADDIASWQLGRDVTDRVRGPRWVVAPAKHDKPIATNTKPDKPAAKPKPDKPTKPDQPAHHIEVDENGLPISR